MKHIYIILLSLLFLNQIGYGQTDTEFWFVVPEGTSGHGGSEPVYVHLAALDAEAIVTIDMPRNGTFTPTTFTIPANGTQRLDLTWYVRSGFTQPINILTSPTLPNTIGNADENNIMESGLAATTGTVENKGLHITSTALITAYLERRVTNNPDIWALKGENAVGTDFYVPSQDWRPNGGYTPTAYNAIDIVATEDTWVYFNPTAAIQGIGAAGATYSRYLLKGQSICLRATGTAIANHLGGTHVWSDGSIVVQWKDDSVAATPGGCRDMMGDQMIPTELAGDEYIVMRGQLSNTREYAGFLSLVTGTILDFVDVDGTPVSSITTGDPGTISKVLLNNFNGSFTDAPPAPAATIDALHIKSRNGEPFLVFHITGFGCEMGAAVLPTIKGCTGSTEVNFQRSTGESFFLNIMCKEAHIDDFKITINNIDYPIPAGWFTEIPGTGVSATTDWWYLDKAFNEFTAAHGGIPAVPVGANSKVSNSTGLFHLGLINGGGGSGCRYGYFSDFSDNFGSAVIASSGSDYLKYCFEDTIQLQASGGIQYAWEYTQTPFLPNTFVPYDPPIPFVDPKTLSTPKVNPPPGFHTYEVVITRPCYLGIDPDTTIAVAVYGYPEIKAVFDTSQIGPDCCSPYEMKYFNESIGANKHEWTFERVTDTLTSIIQNPEVVYFANTTYDVKEVKTSLKVSYTGNCPDTTSKLIPIKPQITAKGTKGSKTGCQQDVTKIFYADITGAGPITSVYWNWGDGGETETLESNLSTLGTNPFEYSHTFVNLNQYDTAYFVTLVFIDSVNDCRDTLTPPYMDTVFVPGVARARFTVDKDKGCSPLEVNFDNVSNGDVTYEWDFGNGGPLATTGNDTSITFSNTTVNPVSYFINLTITKANDDGSFCYDAYLDTITVYPQFNTVISPAGALEGCNPHTVDFSQITTPNVPNLQYEWDFGNGSTSGSSDPLPKIFQHSQATDQIFQVNLTTTSEFNCKSVATPVDVTVYAFVDAKFTVAPDTVGCSPLTLQVANNSHINSVKNFIWYIPGNLGDVPNDLAPFEIIFENKGNAPLVDTIRLSNNNPPHNCPVSTTKRITVNPEITPSFTPNSLLICHDASITFTDNSTYGDATAVTPSGAVSYLWDFGDGTTSSDESPTHAFKNTADNGLLPQIFNVTLTIKYNNACPKILTIPIQVYPKIIPRINADTANICTPALINFGNSSSHAASYKWYLNGGAEQIAPSASYNITNPTTDSITHPVIKLVATNDFCSDSVTKTLNAYPELIPIISSSVASGCAKLPVTFTNSSTGGSLTYRWDFDDGEESTSGEDTVYHEYTNKGLISLNSEAKLTITNNIGCSDSASINIEVYPEVKADFTYIKTKECTPMDVYLANNSLHGTTFKWITGIPGEDTLFKDNSGFPHQYYTNKVSDPSQYTITLIAVDDLTQCSDAISKTIVIYPKIVAAFDIDDDTDCAPHESGFTNNSTGYQFTSHWDFGDGGNGSSATNPENEFNNRTELIQHPVVTLRVTDKNGCDSTITDAMTIYPQVIANFTLKKDINNTCTPYPIDFSYPETALNGNKFTWDFGEGQTRVFTKKDTFSITFDNPKIDTINTYVIRLTSLDTLTGCTDSATREVEVFPHLVPQFRTSNDVYEGCNALTLKFDNQSTGLADYLWDFGDKQTSPEMSPEHIFTHKENKSKNFNVLLKATQTATGCSKDFSRVVTVYSYLNPKFGLRQDTKGSSKAGEPILGGCTPFDVVITDSSTTNYYWHWDFGSADYDEENDNTAPAPRHLTYYNDDEDGTMQNKPYTITLVVENTEGCSKTTSQSLEVYPRAVPDFSVVQVGCHPLEVTFDNNTTTDDSSHYYWNLGDGATAIDRELTHTYFNNSYFDKKVFEVKLTATTKNLCSDFKTKKITVYPTPLAAISPILDRGCSPLTANLINKSKVSSPATFLWDFDNGVTKNLNQITTEEPQYINDGDKAEVKNVQLIVRTDKGCSDTVIQLVNVYPKAMADFIPTVTAGCSPLEVTFPNLSENSIVYRWDFGNGATSQQKSPNHRFINESDNDRVDTVKLVVESPYGCKDSIQRNIAVYLSPNAEFFVDNPTRTYDPDKNDTVFTFENLVKPGPWMFDWDFGDGHFSNGVTTFADQIHKYVGWGPIDEDFSYIVRLIAHSTQCWDTSEQIITINPPKPYIDIKQRNQSGCEDLTVQFDVAFAFGYEQSITWNFGDGGTGSGAQTENKYKDPGVYIATVTIKGDGGIFIDTTKIYVWPLPQPSFEFRPDFVMLPDQPVQFFNTTYLVDESRYLWDFGDGTTDTLVQPWHQYTEAGTYTITLVATTLHGCIATVDSVDAVEVSGEGFIKFPNAFLPTSDSPSDGSYLSRDNDIFHPIHDGVKEYELWIFNRWGEQVFYSDDIQVGWNGRYGNNGAELGQDVYFWKTKGNFNNNVPYKDAGDVTLIRR